VYMAYKKCSFDLQKKSVDRLNLKYNKSKEKINNNK